MSWQAAAWLMLGGSTLLLFLGLPVAFSFLAINLIGAFLFLGGDAGLRRRRHASQQVNFLSLHRDRRADALRGGSGRHDADRYQPR